MKKACSLFLLVFLLVSLVSCGESGEAWQTGETFASLPKYKHGETVSAEFASEANIKINDNSYEHFASYVETLKKSGFEYLKNGSIPENYSLSEGTASWRCTNGEIYLQLIFSENGSKSFDIFGCNVQIYGYSKKPATWGNTK